MSLEDLTGTEKYIDDLTNTNPVASDPKSEGDDHIRGIKNVLKNSFSGVTGEVTSTHTELNILDGVTSTAAELNLLDGVTSTTAELNILDGVTSTTAELNILDGVTSTTAELNYNDITAAGTAEASKAVVLDSNKDSTGIHELTTDNTTLAAISDTSITGNAVDIFIYDTSQDSDGGAWRHRTQDTSWYNETLNTSTRGSRKEFPAVAVIVAESSKVTIYDGDTPDLDMWMVFDVSPNATSNFLAVAGQTLSSISILNGDLCVGFPSADGWGISRINFLSDSQGWYWTSATIYKQVRNSIVHRNASVGYVNSGSGTSALNNAAVNDVAMTVLPNAPIDSATGLPVPTIAVATDGGVSVIKDDGNVWDITTVFDTNNIAISIQIDNERLYFSSREGIFPVSTLIPSSDISAIQSSDILYWWAGTSASTAGYDIVLPNFNPYTVIITEENKKVLGGANGGLHLQVNNPISPLSSLNAIITSNYNTGYMVGDIKGAWGVDTDEGATVTCDDVDATDSGLITNGTFDSNTTGWSESSTGIVSHDTGGDGGRMKVTITASQQYGYQGFTTVSGETYSITFTAAAGSVTPYVYIGTSAGNGSLYFNQVADTRTVTFVATGSTTYISLKVFGSSGDTGYLDNVSVRLAIPDRSVNNNAIGIHGTLDVDAVATGAELKALSGFSASNYLKQPYNSDLDFGTGDFSFSGWCKSSNFAGTNRILGRADGSSSHRLSLYVAAGNLYIFTNESGSQSYTYTPISADNTWHYINAVRSSGTVRLYVNGVEKSTTTSTHNLTTTSNAPFILGAESFNLGVTIDSPFNGSLALWRVSGTAPTAEQIKEIYEAEKPLFQENAKCTLNGSSDAVTALAHDDITNVLSVGTSGGRSDFQGLVRVDENTDNITELAAHDGMIIQEY